MQHSLFRDLGETVKLFSHKDPTKVRKSLTIYSFTSRGFEEITQSYPITDLNIGYYSTEINTPDEHCYLMIMFCGNPIVLRVGLPEIQFVYWSHRNRDIPYSHFSETGSVKSQGLLHKLDAGFYFYTPIDDSLGYIEVDGKANIIDIPYSIKTAGIGIDVDWRRTIIRQVFGIDTTKLNFTLNKVIIREFSNSVFEHNFSVQTKVSKFDLDIIKQNFNVFCK